MATTPPTVGYPRAPSRALEIGTDVFLSWRDAEIAIAVKDLAATNEQERLLRIDLQNRLQLSEQHLHACEKKLELIQKNEETMDSDLQNAKVEWKYLRQVETDLQNIKDALKKAGIRLHKDTDTEEVIWLQLICDLDADARWAQVQRERLTEYERGLFLNRPLDSPFCTPTSSKKVVQQEPLDAIAAINTLLDNHHKHIVEDRTLRARCDTAESEVARLKKEMETKESRIAELEQTVASLGGEELRLARGAQELTCINPSHLLKNPEFSPYLSETSSSPLRTNPFQSIAYNDSEASSSSPSSAGAGDPQSFASSSAPQIQSKRPSSSNKNEAGYSNSNRIWYRQFADS